MIRSAMFVALAAGAMCSVASASFTQGNLVVMKVSNANALGTNAVMLAEVSKSGVSTGYNVAVDATAAGLTVRGSTNHDRHLHRSTDGRYLTFTGYGYAAGATDPATLSSTVAPRVVGIVDGSGSVDLSTRLTDAYNNTGIRGAFTTNGTDLWLSGDNAGGAVADALTGGLRYTTRGSSITTNISKVQTLTSPTPDNVRDAQIFDGQLYDCSGSSASIGKGVLIVGSGTPTAGSQPATLITPGSQNSSSFFMLDMNPAVPGVDTLYSAGTNLFKFTKNTSGSWVAAGSLASTAIGEIRDVIAESNADGSVSVFASSTLGVVKLTDTNALGTLTGSFSTIMTPEAGYTFGGLAFSIPAPSAAALLGLAPLALRRRRR